MDLWMDVAFFLGLLVLASLAGYYRRQTIEWMQEAERAYQAIDDLAEAIRLTREYAGPEIMPMGRGWAWYEALRKYAPKVLGEMIVEHYSDKEWE